MRIRGLAVLGVGLLGGSVAMAARRRLKVEKITGYAHRAETLAAATAGGVLDQAYDDPNAAVREADLVVICTPVSLIAPLTARIAGDLRNGAIVTDVGSTKRSIVEAADRAMRPGVHFVGSHPMAGSEKRGLEFATPGLFEGAVCIMTPSERSNLGAMETVERFWQGLGMRTTRLTPEEHDRRLAEVSHLPHAVAAALVAMQEDRSLELCGRGFLDMTRIAAGDPGLWQDILLDNRVEVRASLARLIGRLQELDAMLEADRSEKLNAWLASAGERRRTIADRPRK